MNEDIFSKGSKHSLESLDEMSQSKRSRQFYHHHHRLQHRPQIIPPSEPVQIIPASVDQLLIQSIKQICEEEGIRQDVYDPIIESVALEGLRNITEEFILKFCTIVRRSMVASRRTAPIPPDFEAAIESLNLPLPDDQIDPYKTNPDINPPLLPTPPPEDPFHDVIKYPESFLGPALSNQSALQKFSFATNSLPPLPSAHTYRDTAVFSTRETDSRRIREIATEEGKFGEQALRKLAGAVKVDAARPVDVDMKTQISPDIKRPKRRRKVGPSEEAIFEETMQDLLKNEPDGFELGPIVTAEKAYRMPDDGQTKRRPAVAEKPKQ